MVYGDVPKEKRVPLIDRPNNGRFDGSRLDRNAFRDDRSGDRRGNRSNYGREGRAVSSNGNRSAYYRSVNRAAELQ